MQITDPVIYGGTINGVLALNGRIACSGVTGRKIDIYNDGATIYGFGLNDFEYCVFGGEGSAFTYRIAKPGAVDLAGEIALFVNAAGVGIPVGRPISWGSNTLLVDATGALLVNGAPIAGGGGASGTASITGGTIDATAIGNTTPAAIRGTTLALTGSLTARFVFAAPNAAAGAPTWRQLLASDISGLGTFATADPAAPPALGATTANTGRFSTLTHTGFLLRSLAAGLTASTTNTQAGALGLTASVNIITTAAANSAVRLPNAAPAAGTAAEIIVRNNGANAVNCYPPTGAIINSLAANALISIPAGSGMRFLQTTTTQYYTV